MKREEFEKLFEKELKENKGMTLFCNMRPTNVMNGKGYYYDYDFQKWALYSVADFDVKIEHYLPEEEFFDDLYEEFAGELKRENNKYAVSEPGTAIYEILKQEPRRGIVKEEDIYVQPLSERECSLEGYRGSSNVVEVPKKINDMKPVLLDMPYSEVFILSIPNSVSVIKQAPQYIRKINGTNGIKRIEDYAFLNRWGLTEINLPDSVEYIGKRAFAGTSITQIKIPSRITELEGTFICTKLVDVVVPGNVKKLDYQVFAQISTLENVRLEKGVEYVGEFVFSDNPNLHSVYIDSSVIYIDETNFWDCASDFKIITTKNSYAAEYANSHGILVEEID